MQWFLVDKQELGLNAVPTERTACTRTWARESQHSCNTMESERLGRAGGRGGWGWDRGQLGRG